MLRVGISDTHITSAVVDLSGPADFGPRATTGSAATEGLYHPTLTYIPREVDISENIEGVRRRLARSDPDTPRIVIYVVPRRNPLTTGNIVDIRPVTVQVRRP